MSIASTSPDRAALAELEHRASLYKLVALGFLYPGDAVAQLFTAEGDIARGALRSGNHGCVLARFARFLAERRLTPEDLVHEYNRLFFGDRPVQLLECEYLCPHEFEKARTLADIMGFYHAFAVEPRAERADHLSSELEFMCWLTIKEAQALEENQKERLEVGRDAARKFLDEHLCAWAPAFFDALATRGGADSFYVRLAEILKTLLAKERQRLGKV